MKGSIRHSQQPNFPRLSFLPGTELLKSFDGPSDPWIYIARLMHVAARGREGGVREEGERSETGKLIE